jgi:hypothetical protein
MTRHAMPRCLRKRANLRHLTRDLGQAIPCRIELGHQAVTVAACYRMQARIIPVRRLDRQEPTVLAQLSLTSYLGAHTMLEFLGFICDQPKWRERKHVRRD